jgi:protein tyrosine phosphatase (PTP) superfamily phosphohydrolase (DUF442 family)
MDKLEDIRAFLPLDSRLATSGQPTEAQFTAIRDAGFETVINLAMPNSTSALPDEATTVHALGMEYVALPVVWEDPKVEDAERFFAEMEARRGQKLFVHCAMNMRVSAFIYLWRTLREGWTAEQATPDLHRIWVPEGRWATFMDDVAKRVE